jgi:hypothetical protein
VWHELRQVDNKLNVDVSEQLNLNVQRPEEDDELDDVDELLDLNTLGRRRRRAARPQHRRPRAPWKVENPRGVRRARKKACEEGEVCVTFTQGRATPKRGEACSHLIRCNDIKKTLLHMCN